MTALSARPATQETLVQRVAALLVSARAALAGSPAEADVLAIERRLHEPLRAALAGKVKSGKSTLLNALIGEQLAPTDAGECTRVITWYQDGPTYRVTVEPHDGPPQSLRFTRHGGALEVALDGMEPADVDRLVVEWPSATLRRMTLIDTP